MNPLNFNFNIQSNAANYSQGKTWNPKGSPIYAGMKKPPSLFGPDRFADDSPYRIYHRKDKKQQKVQNKLGSLFF